MDFRNHLIAGLKFTLSEIQEQPPDVFYERGVLKFSQNSQENTYTRFSFNRVAQASGLQLY